MKTERKMQRCAPVGCVWQGHIIDVVHRRLAAGVQSLLVLLPALLGQHQLLEVSAPLLVTAWQPTMLLVRCTSPPARDGSVLAMVPNIPHNHLRSPASALARDAEVLARNNRSPTPYIADQHAYCCNKHDEVLTPGVPSHSPGSAHSVTCDAGETADQQHLGDVCIPLRAGFGVRQLQRDGAEGHEPLRLRCCRRRGRAVCPRGCGTANGALVLHGH